jgi:hypothetical protein
MLDLDNNRLKPAAFEAVIKRCTMLTVLKNDGPDWKGEERHPFSMAIRDAIHQNLLKE